MWAKAGAADTTAASATVTRDRLRIDDASKLESHQRAIFAMMGCTKLKSPFRPCLDAIDRARVEFTERGPARRKVCCSAAPAALVPAPASGLDPAGPRIQRFD